MRQQECIASSHWLTERREINCLHSLVFNSGILRVLGALYLCLL